MSRTRFCNKAARGARVVCPGGFVVVTRVVRASDGSHAHFIGNEFDISAAWQVDRHLTAYSGWAHLFTGQFINDTGAHSDPDFFYVILTYTF